MTIFTKVAKELIGRVLIKSTVDSIASDKATFFGCLRDNEISDTQRTMTYKLQKKIDRFACKENDKQSLVALKEIIIETDTQVEAYRKTKNWPRGNLNTTLTGLDSNLNRFYQAIRMPILELIDIPENNNPFNILCAHAVYYLGEHILYPPEEGIFIKTINFISSFVSNASAIEIRAEKEKCLIRNLVECKKKIDGLNKEGVDYEELCSIFVSDTIETILRENADICEESAPISTIPIQLTAFAVARFPAPEMKPSRGRLKVAMDSALEDIREAQALKPQNALMI